MPVADVVREHQEVALVVLSRECGIAPVDHPREQGHALVACRFAVERGDAEGAEVGRLDELRQDLEAVEGGVDRVVEDRAVVVAEAHETSVFHALALGRAGREDDPLGDLRLSRELDGVVRGRDPVDDPCRLIGHGPVDAMLVQVRDGRLELLEREPGRQRIEHQAGDLVEHAQLIQLHAEDVVVIERFAALADGGVATRLVDGDVATRSR